MPGLLVNVEGQAQVEADPDLLAAALLNLLDNSVRYGASLLAVYALFDNDPQAVNRIESGFAKVTPALIQKTAFYFNDPATTEIYTIQPGTAAAQGAK